MKVQIDFEELTAMLAHRDRSVAGVAMGPASQSEKVTEDAIHHAALGKENLSLATSLWVHFRGGVGVVKLSAVKAAMNAIRAQAPLAKSISVDSCVEESLGENIQILIIASGLKWETNFPTA